MQQQNSTRIYTLSDPITKEVRYVGKTQDRSTNRLSHHVKDAIRGHRRYVCNWIRSLLINGRAPVMDVIQVIPAGGDWQSAERQWIAHYRANGARLTNLTDGGDGTSGWDMPEETRQLLAKLGREISDETRAKRSAALKGRVIPEHQRVIISECQRARKHKPCAEETKAKISTGNKGNRNALGAVRDAETRQRMSKAQSIRNLADAKALVSDESVLEIRERYVGTEVTMDELAAEFKVSSGTIYRIVRGKCRLDAGGPICTGKFRKLQVKCRARVYRQQRKSTAPTFSRALSPPVNGSS